MDVGSIGILKVALTTLLRTTPVAKFNGSVAITTGNMVAPVLKVHT